MARRDKNDDAVRDDIMSSTDRQASDEPQEDGKARHEGNKSESENEFGVNDYNDSTWM